MEIKLDEKKGPHDFKNQNLGDFLKTAKRQTPEIPLDMPKFHPYHMKKFQASVSDWSRSLGGTPWYKGIGWVWPPLTT